MPRSYREEFITGPKQEFTRTAAQEVLLDGRAPGPLDAEPEPAFECRSPLEEFEVAVPARPTTEQELAESELLDAKSVMVTFVWWKPASGSSPLQERRSETLELGYELPGGTHVYQWRYEGLRVFDEAGRLVDASVSLGHLAESGDAEVRKLLGESDQVSPMVILERARRRTELLEMAKKNCPNLGGEFKNGPSRELSRVLSDLRGKTHTWEHPTGDARMPVVTQNMQFTFTLDIDAQRRCLEKNLNLKRPTLSVTPLRVRFHTNRPGSTSSTQLDEVTPRAADLDELFQKLAEVFAKATVDIRLVIRGYTDKQGKAAQNLELSERRAKWLQGMLEKQFPGKIKGIDTCKCGDEYAPLSPADDQRFRVAVVEVVPLLP